MCLDRDSCERRRCRRCREEVVVAEDEERRRRRECREWREGRGDLERDRKRSRELLEVLEMAAAAVDASVGGRASGSWKWGMVDVYCCLPLFRWYHGNSLSSTKMMIIQSFRRRRRKVLLHLTPQDTWMSLFPLNKNQIMEARSPKVNQWQKETKVDQCPGFNTSLVLATCAYGTLLSPNSPVYILD